MSDIFKPKKTVGTFTKRELEIIAFISEGYNNTHIASILSVVDKTVEKHINNILKKTEIPDTMNPRVFIAVEYLKSKIYNK